MPRRFPSLLAAAAALVAACGGAAGGPDAAPGGDGGALDAQPGEAFVRIGGQDTALPYVEAYLYIYDATIELRLNASTAPDFDCFGEVGCTSVYVTLPEDAVLGVATCETAGVALLVQRDDAYFSSTGGEPAAACALAVEARGPVGAWTSITDIAGTLRDAGGAELVIEDGAIGAVRSDDIAPP
jgi:hypothetical protein